MSLANEILVYAGSYRWQIKTLIANCIATLYTSMIRTFRHVGLQLFFETGSKAGIRPDHAARLRVQLTALDAATRPQDMNLPGWKFHHLAGELSGHYAVTVKKNWRLIFAFDNGHAVLVDYRDYH